MIVNDRKVIRDARGRKYFEKLLVRRFEGKDIDNSLNKLIFILAQKFSDYFIIILKNFIEAVMNCFFLELDGMIENLVDPTLADIELCYFIAFYYLPDEVVCLVEDCLQGIVLLF